MGNVVIPSDPGTPKLLVRYDDEAEILQGITPEDIESAKAELRAVRTKTPAKTDVEIAWDRFLNYTQEDKDIDKTVAFLDALAKEMGLKNE